MIKVRILQKEVATGKEWWSEYEIYGYSPEGEATFDEYKWGMIVVAIFNDRLAEDMKHKKRECIKVEVLYKDHWEE